MDNVKVTVMIRGDVFKFIKKYHQETGLQMTRIVHNALLLYKDLLDKGALKGKKRLVLLDEKEDRGVFLKYNNL
ncbi:MAG: hypothetical protein AAB674_03075 [Patescibacteria group bacterium]